MGEVRVVGITEGVLALGERGDSAVSEEGVAAIVLFETAIVDLLQVLNMHRLGEAGVLANQLYGISVGLSFVARLFGLR